MNTKSSPNAKRYLIDGCGGAGKSTLARKIVAMAGIPYVDTDALYWTKDWRLRSDEKVIALLPLAEDA